LSECSTFFSVYGTNKPINDIQNILIFLTEVLTYIMNNTLSAITAANGIGGIMVRVLASSAVDRGFEPQLGQTKDYKIGICCFSAKYTALRRMSKDWLAWNQNNVSK
jgi:hypothetical protein